MMARFIVTPITTVTLIDSTGTPRAFPINEEAEQVVDAFLGFAALT